MRKCFLILLMISLFFLVGCGTLCFNVGSEKYGVTGEICYSPEQSKVEGNIVFLDSEGKKIIGLDEKDIKDIIKIIESGKKLWDYGKDFFGISTQEFASERLQRILQEYRKNGKD
jgi:hypothetical protein